MRRLAVALLTLTCLAAAPDAPAMTPLRDVDVVYRVSQPGGAEPLEQRVRWDVAGARERVDPPTPGLHVIVDLHSHRIASVRDAERLVLQLDGIGGPVPGADASAYQRRGSDSVAGLECGIWQPADDSAAPLFCFTADGVLLRVTAEHRTVAEAVSVRYGPIDPDVFRVPADYRRITPGGAAAPEETTP